MGEAFLEKIGYVDKPKINNYYIAQYPIATDQIIKSGDFVVIESGTVKLATGKADGIAKESGTSGQTINVFMNALVAEYTDFTDTSIFNIGQNSTKTFVSEKTPISDGFIRLSKTSYNYPAVGFKIDSSNKSELKLEENMVAVILYKYTSDTTGLPRVGWYKNATDYGYACWNCTSDSFWNGFPQKRRWAVHRVKWDKANYKDVNMFGICQLELKDNVVLDIAGIWFYKLSDASYANPNIINSLGPTI